VTKSSPPPGDKSPEITVSTRPSLVFVHGICHGSWCWEDNFVGYFTALGWDCHAVTLRGHDHSSRQEAMRHRIADYVADVRAVTNALASPPILVGHSMGGYVVQKYLEQTPAAGAVLLAAMPPRGGLLSPLLWRNLFRLSVNMARSDLRRSFDTPERCRNVFFSKHTPERTVVQATRRLSQESTLAALDMLGGDRVRLQEVCDTPILVMGAAEDRIFGAAQVKRTARRYGTSAVIVDRTGHDMMLEPTWEFTASHIATWLRQHCDVSQS
jgi:pimeloyl-ACP methyl ester carboxylesterase